METTESKVGFTPASKSMPRGLQGKLEQMRGGLELAVPEAASIQVRGQLLARSALETQMTEMLAGFQQLEAALTAVKVARAHLNAQLHGMNQQYLGFRDGLVALLGRDNPQLAHLGVPVAKPSRPLTPEQNVVRATKARKTRELRHTLGKRQKAKLQYQGTLQVAVGAVESTDSASEIGATPGAG